MRALVKLLLSNIMPYTILTDRTCKAFTYVNEFDLKQILCSFDYTRYTVYTYIWRSDDVIYDTCNIGKYV